MKISLRDKKISPWDMKIQNFLMWFKNGLGASALSGRVGQKQGLSYFCPFRACCFLELLGLQPVL